MSRCSCMFQSGIAIAWNGWRYDLVRCLIAGIAISLAPETLAGQEQVAGGKEDRSGSGQEMREDLAAVQSLKSQVEAMKLEYEKRIRELEAQLEQIQTQLLKLPVQALEPAAQAPAAGQTTQSIPGALNPAIFVVGNFLGRADGSKVFNAEGDRIDNQTNLRETEIDLRVPIDPFSDGVLITSLEAETPGRFEAGVEEAYVNIKKLPFLSTTPLGLKLKAGRFRPAFGRNNILHTHDLPQSMRPLPVQEFLGEEGFVQNGLSAGFFIPTPWDDRSSLDATVEVLNGGEIAVAPDTPGRISYLGHLRWFRTFRDTHNLELGWSSYVRPPAGEARSIHLHGVDFTYRWKPLRMGQWRSFLTGGELYFSGSRIPLLADSAQPRSGLERDSGGKPVGFTLFGQWQFNRRTYAGLRWDHTDKLADSRVTKRSITPYVSYYFSEYLRFRLNYEHRRSDLAEERTGNSVFLELNWVFGSHPTEPYWVNK